ncbi:P-loop containing nucleoside triphosphate hydrolase protein [Rhizoclosmatium globosum]|uniref:p-loop containing nucleoside triphosphate hydrolase protein n=1 Tax=Rhizoclosmatium globosum TaxID=329046 RepID=A0A1Y2CBM9_9FUNG|nr:P-loop containing nucleoside triphosphate hydrolase protein [Rhizoclosmatium globosum]|eukprot:ORY44432.1 P-loop containing nucleoside triphosphate hydrolase protein [Rhizoclosmatium globosum]
MAGYLWSFCAYLGAKKRPVPLPQEGVTVSFQNVGYRLKRHKKPIIDGVSGMIKPGHVLAIMGPSGAGKSTFLDILAGKSKSGIVTGSVLFDNIPMSPQLQRNLIGFVDQEDTLMPTLTVRETLMFSAQLRLPESISKEDKIKKVNEVMATLGLSHVANTRVGGHGKRGISGGEKRRVSIGVELVTSPSVIVLDEPTSGLDSFNAIHVIKTLSDLARKLRKTVIFTIHQPRSDAYALFDQVLVLAKGKTLYFGPGSSAGMFFKQRGSACPEGYNMADHLLDMASVDSLAVDRFSTDSLPVIPLRQSDSIVEDDGTQIEEFEKDHMERRISTVSLIIDSLVPVEKPKRRQVGFYTQVKILSGRAFKNLIRTPSLLLAHIIIAVALGAFVGGLYYQSGTTLGGIQNRLGSIIFILALLGFSGLSAIGSFAVEKQLFLRERGNGFYGPMAYFLTKVIFDIVPLRLLPAVAMGTIAYKLIGFTDGRDHFTKYISMLIFFSAEIGLLCLTFAITISDIGTATLLGSIIILFKMLFAGFLINQSSIPPALSWIQYLSFFRYAYEAMIVNDLTDVQIHDNVSGSNITIPVSVVLDKFGFDVNAYWRDFIVSVGLLIGLLVLNAAFVQFRLKETR